MLNHKYLAFVAIITCVSLSIMFLPRKTPTVKNKSCQTCQCIGKDNIFVIGPVCNYNNFLEQNNLDKDKLSCQELCSVYSAKSVKNQNKIWKD